MRQTHRGPCSPGANLNEANLHAAPTSPGPACAADLRTNADLRRAILADADTGRRRFQRRLSGPRRDYDVGQRAGCTAQQRAGCTAD